MTLGAIIGNIKPGSVFRNLSSLPPLWKHIGLKKTVPFVLPLALGSAVGAFGITHVTQEVVPFVLLFGLLVVEGAPLIAAYITTRTEMLSSFAVGAYGGIFGAGISLLIVALMRLRETDDSKLISVRADALFLETFLAAVSVSVFLFSGLISFPIALTWILGASLGGYLGGKLLNYTGKLSGDMQKNIVRIAFVIAILVAFTKM